MGRKPLWQRAHPCPGTGIVHTINLEQLATLATIEKRGGADWLIPDTLIGLDSRTPMVNGLGVLDRTLHG